MTGVDELRAQIAEALLADGHSLRFGPDGYVLDRTLPVVTAWAEQQARERAAEELRAAASSDGSRTHGGQRYAVDVDRLHARSAALADDGPTS